MMNQRHSALPASIAILLASAAVASCAREPAEAIDEKKSAVADLALTGGEVGGGVGCL